MSPRKRSSVASRRRPSVPKAKRPKAPIPDPPEYLRRLGVQPRKSLGQHFLIDQFILADIARACCPNGGETVLEIGAGPGGLTEELANLAGRVVAVELDEDLAASTRERLKRFDHLEIIAADVMDFEPDELLAEGNAAPPYTACGNLPYYITQPIVRRMLEAQPGPERVVVLVQREVAQRIAGGPGQESLLSISVKVYGAPRVLFAVPHTAFWPPPKVQSAVIAIEKFTKPALDLPGEEIELFFHLVRAGFAQPRKQLHNVLTDEFTLERAPVLVILAEAGIEAMARAQHLQVADWERLYGIIKGRHPALLEARESNPEPEDEFDPDFADEFDDEFADEPDDESNDE